MTVPIFGWEGGDRSSMRDQLFLYSILLHPPNLAHYMGNVPIQQFFQEDKNAYIFECMEEVFIQHGTVDLILLANELNERKMLAYCGGVQYLSDLVGVPQ